MLHILGIRHHGPGSARSVRQALKTLQPDLILVEGPPDAADVLHFLARDEMKPPVALLIYGSDEPKRAAYFPFAAYSPEWQAIRWGVTHHVPVRFMDLPQSHQFALHRQAEEELLAKLAPIATEDQEPAPETDPNLQSPVSDLPPPVSDLQSPVSLDPLGWLAQAAGYPDGERWWEHLVEQRRESQELFTAILEAMSALRQEVEKEQAEQSDSFRPGLQLGSPFENAREAYMRQTIRAAQKEGFSTIAVICGAWHAPVLTEEFVNAKGRAKADAETLKGLPKLAVNATCIPWTNSRLTRASGYGAGIESPGWYAHLWETAHLSSSEITTRWLARVAHLLRQQDLDASSASLIEAVRLAETLAALRARPLPGLPELNEATQAVLCFGQDAPLQLIYHKLTVGETLGEVPDDTPAVPLQSDLQRQQKRLRLPPEATHRDLDLDLRKENERERSYLLHRLNLLAIPWGTQQRSNAKTSTFHELWRIQWHPEFAVALIEASRWGTTVFEAATQRVQELADSAADLPALTQLLDGVLLAELPDASQHLLARVQNEAALASDVALLMGALPSLANILRYGNVRQTDTAMVQHVVDNLVTRICVGLPGACASLDDDAASAMVERIISTHGAITLLQKPEQVEEWVATLTHLADQQGIHGLVAGRACRLLGEQGAFSAHELERRLRLGLTLANEPTQAAAWLEGMLRGSGSLLVHDELLLPVIDGWLVSLSPEIFTTLLPLIRRTFATFSKPERRNIGERIKAGGVKIAGNALDEPMDVERAEAVLPLIARLLGIPLRESETVRQ